MSNYTSKFSSHKKLQLANNSIYKSASNLMNSGRNCQEISLEHLLNKLSTLSQGHDNFITKLENIGIVVSSLEEKVNSIAQLSKLQQNCIEAHENELARQNEIISSLETKFPTMQNSKQPSM